MEKFLIRKKRTENSHEDHNCSSAKYNKLSCDDFSDEEGSQTSEDVNSDFSEHHGHLASNSTCSTDNSDSIDKNVKLIRKVTQIQ